MTRLIDQKQNAKVNGEQRRMNRLNRETIAIYAVELFQLASAIRKKINNENAFEIRGIYQKTNQEFELNGNLTVKGNKKENKFEI